MSEGAHRSTIFDIIKHIESGKSARKRGDGGVCPAKIVNQNSKTWKP